MALDNKNIIAVCQYLIDTGVARSFSQIAKACGKTTQYFTDLKSGKAQYSLSFLDLLCDKYPVNKSFVLTGEGEMLRENSAETPQHIDFSALMELIKSQQKVIENLSDTVKNLTDHK